MGRQERQESKKDREQSKKEEVKTKGAKASEDAFWKEAGEGSKSKAEAKREEEERKKIETAAKKAEAKKLLEQEEAALSAAKVKKVAPAGTQKLTKYQMDRQREQEEKEKEAQLREKGMEAKREMSEDAYSSIVATENVNRVGDVDGASARNVTEALSVLGVKDAGPEAEKHPEKRMRSAWLAYEERMMPLFKQEKPGLKMSQYKDMCWKQWQKAPENPLVAAAAAGLR